jgi:DNA-binding PadR family transcriptional regulator
VTDGTQAQPPRCQFNLAPPRHFLYPAVLLLLAEEPRHGYRLVGPLQQLGFGPIDRPSVYRALADLAVDGLLESWDAPSTAGSGRHVYGVTEAGRSALTSWMAIMAQQQRNLARIVNRFQDLMGPDGSLDLTDVESLLHLDS